MIYSPNYIYYFVPIELRISQWVAYLDLNYWQVLYDFCLKT